MIECDKAGSTLAAISHGIKVFLMPCVECTLVAGVLPLAAIAA
jgi:hypothetical protein